MEKTSTLEQFADFVKMYRTQPRLIDNYEVSDALMRRAQDLGLSSYADVDTEENEDNEIYAATK